MTLLGNIAIPLCSLSIFVEKMYHIYSIKVNIVQTAVFPFLASKRRSVWHGRGEGGDTVHRY